MVQRKRCHAVLPCGGSRWQLQGVFTEHHAARSGVQSSSVHDTSMGRGTSCLTSCHGIGPARSSTDSYVFVQTRVFSPVPWYRRYDVNFLCRFINVHCRMGCIGRDHRAVHRFQRIRHTADRVPIHESHHHSPRAAVVRSMQAFETGMGKTAADRPPGAYRRDRGLQRSGLYWYRSLPNYPVQRR